MRKTPLVSFFLASALVVGLPTMASALTSSDITLSSAVTLVTNNNVVKSNIASDPATGNSLVTYIDRNDGGKLKGIIVSPELTAVGSEFTIFNLSLGGSPSAAAWNEDDNLWLVGTLDGTETKVVPVSASGTVGTVITAMNAGPASEAIGDLEGIAISYSPDQDKFLVAIKATLQGASDCQVALGVFVSADGTTTSGPDGSLISDDAACEYSVNNGVTLAYSTAIQKWLLAYYQFSNDTAALNDQSGAVLVGGTTVPTVASDPIVYGDNTTGGGPDVAYNHEKDEFFVSWPQEGVSDYHSLGNIISGDGTSAGTVFDVITEEIASGPKPRVTYNAYSNVYFSAQYVWTNFDGSSSRNNILVTARDADGVITAPVLVSDGTENASRPDIANVGDCSVIVWTSNTGVRVRSVCAPEGVDAAALASTGIDMTGLLGFGALALAGGVAVRRFGRARTN